MPLRAIMNQQDESEHEDYVQTLRSDHEYDITGIKSDSDNSEEVVFIGVSKNNITPTPSTVTVSNEKYGKRPMNKSWKEKKKSKKSNTGKSTGRKLITEVNAVTKFSSTSVRCALKSIQTAMDLADSVLSLKWRVAGDISEWPISENASVALITCSATVQFIEGVTDHIKKKGGSVPIVWNISLIYEESEYLLNNYVLEMVLHTEPQDCQFGSKRLFIWKGQKSPSGNKTIAIQKSMKDMEELWKAGSASLEHVNHVVNLTDYSTEVLSQFIWKVLDAPKVNKYIALDEPKSDVDVRVYPMIKKLREVVKRKCVCGGHEFLNNITEKQSNEDCESDIAPVSGYVPFNMTISEKDIVSVPGLMKHTSIFLSKSFDESKISKYACQELTDGCHQVHGGLYIKSSSLRKLLSMENKLIDLIYPACILQDAESCYLNRHALCHFEMRELYISGVSNRLLSVIFRDQSLASAINENKNAPSTIYEPVFMTEAFLNCIRKHGHEGFKKQLPIIVKINREALYKYKDTVRCWKCKSYELFVDYGVHYHHFD